MTIEEKVLNMHGKKIRWKLYALNALFKAE